MSLFLLELTLEMFADIFLTENDRGCDNEAHQRSQQHESPVKAETFGHPIGSAEPDSTANEIRNHRNHPSANDDRIVILFHNIFSFVYISRKCHCGVTFLVLITNIIYDC